MLKILFLLYTLYVAGTMLAVLGHEIIANNWRSPYPKRMLVILGGSLAWLAVLVSAT